jgi:hypothetical protein
MGMFEASFDVPCWLRLRSKAERKGGFDGEAGVGVRDAAVSGG